MIMVSISTFSWSSLRDLLRHPRLSSAVMLVTVAVVVATHDLAAGVACGVLLNGLFFSFQVMRLVAVSTQDSADGQTRTYHVRGELFFASASLLPDAVDFQDNAPDVIIDLADARLWDLSAAATLEKTVSRLRARHKQVRILNAAPRTTSLLTKLGHESLLG